MRTAIAVSALAAAIGFGAGWASHGGPREITRLVYRDRPEPSAPLPKSTPPFPEYPKPPLEIPTATPVGTAAAGAAPPILVGDLPRLPSLNGPLAPGGILPPNVPSKLPSDDLNADEAFARRVVLGAGGDIVSAADAKDASGKVGRALVAETDRESLEGLKAALRKALGNRAILSEGGMIGGSSPDARKAEDALAALKKQRDRARIDFLPESPTLRDLEEATLKAERALSDLRKTTAHQRLNILLRPTLQ